MPLGPVAVGVPCHSSIQCVCVVNVCDSEMNCKSLGASAECC